MTARAKITKQSRSPPANCLAAKLQNRTKSAPWVGAADLPGKANRSRRTAQAKIAKRSQSPPAIDSGEKKTANQSCVLPRNTFPKSKGLPRGFGMERHLYFLRNHFRRAGVSRRSGNFKSLFIFMEFGAKNSCDRLSRTKTSCLE